jgi:sortase A
VVAVLRVPAWGAGYEVPVLAGTTKDLLTRGVGHYPSSAAPGQIGNCALTGLRVTHGQPFARLHELERGARVEVETRRAIFTYVVDVPPRDLTVQPRDSWVLQPVPGEPGAKPSQALLTLTTAQDVLPTSDRSVGFAHLASTQNKG